jgi:hypothetical protein
MTPTMAGEQAPAALESREDPPRRKPTPSPSRTAEAGVGVAGVGVAAAAFDSEGL